MIAENEVMPLLVGACPSFAGRWHEYVSDPIYDPDLLYVHLGELASHLVALMDRGATSEFQAVFDVTERLLLDENIHVRRAMTVGFLEGIQNVSGGRVDPERFVPHLRPETARKWQLLNDSWNGDIDAARRLDT